MTLIPSTPPQETTLPGQKPVACHCSGHCDGPCTGYHTHPDCPPFLVMAMLAASQAMLEECGGVR